MEDSQFFKIVECDCLDWAKSMKQITDMMIYLILKNKMVEYTGKMFKYCPWCGKELKENYGEST